VTRPGPKRISAGERAARNAEWVRRYGEGDSTAAIAADSGVTASAVAAALKASGVRMNSPTSKRRGNKECAYWCGRGLSGHRDYGFDCSADMDPVYRHACRRHAALLHEVLGPA
jgi:hypothetical protein